MLSDFFVLDWDSLDDCALRLDFENVGRDSRTSLQIGKPADLVRRQRNSDFYRCGAAQSARVQSCQIFLDRQVHPLQHT
jgi:hypothetical protein